MASETPTNELFLEIGCEELPARFMDPALEQLKAAATAAFEEARLPFVSIDAFGTPRRLALVVRELASEQPTQTVCYNGPKEEYAYKDGEPTKALLGFVKGRGASVEDVEIIDTPKGKVVSVEVTELGKRTSELLQDILPGLIRGLSFPKSMRWIEGSKFRFGRPIRWICALFNGDVVPFELEHLKSGDASYGHRFINGGRFRCKNFEDYRVQLNQRYVTLRQDLRRETIKAGIKKIAEAEGATKTYLDESLLNELTYLVERPLVLKGQFDDEFLELPTAVLVASMQGHQRYVPLEGPDGKLLSTFAFVSNNLNDDRGLIRQGNESFLRSRLDDALFFWREDQMSPLSERVDDLKSVTWHAELGTVYEKTRRLERIVNLLGQHLGSQVDAAAVQTAERAATICKTDLITHMIQEFPELQGTMGREYALRCDKAPESVALAIEEHYQPKGSGDALPTSMAGTLLALAERLDTLSGILATGYAPKGNEDPFQLRRASLGILRLLQEHELRLNIPSVVAAVAELHKPKVGELPDGLTVTIFRYILDRLRNALVKDGIEADVIEAVFSGNVSDPVDARNRVEALARLSADREAFAPVSTVLKRVIRIIPEDFSPGPVVAEHMSDAAERKLWEAFTEARPKLDAALENEHYSEFLNLVVGLKPAIDGFFDEVLVNAEDEAVRHNRLAMLALIRGSFTRFADFSLIVTE